MNWFCDLPYRHKVFVAGNHDMCLYGAEGIEGLTEDVHYLCNSGVEIDGWRFWGFPLYTEDCIMVVKKTITNKDFLIHILDTRSLHWE